MLNWKIQQEIYHKLNQYHDDDLSLHNIEITDNIIRDAIKYFTTTELGWVYPAKSYVVGICYAKWLNQYFAEDFYESLNDVDLLFGNDPYFVPYEKDKNAYDEIINIVGFNFDETLGIIPDIKKYFIEEFLINYE
jgi:hypothetical protein